VATGCAVASSPEEVRSSPSPTAALPLPTAHPAAAPQAAQIRQTSTSGKGRLVNGWFGLRRVVRVAGRTVSAAVLSVTAAGPALAQTPPSLNQVLDAATAWLVGLLASLATLFLTVGGIRYMAGATDPGEVEKAKTALKAAAIGYALAALAPLAVRILKQIVGV
jgi:Type IV secretion system pilin